MRRLAIYLAATFTISWGCWWTLASQMPAGGSVSSSGLLATLYLLGGFGPAIGALIAVGATPREGPFPEYVARLTRWRVSPLWWLAVLAVPVAFAVGKEWIAIWTGGGVVRAADLAPLKRLVILLPSMILGGGLEELGWRGVAQPQLERRASRVAAALIVGVIWALWHLPLFHMAGVSQSGRNFPLFAADVLANACLLAWVYAGTRSILLCVAFHAVSNSATAMGLLAIGPPTGAGAWIAVTVKLGAAVLLLTGAPRRMDPP
jgi:membrane protease YdiL (CAAX protease family)